MPCVPGKRVWFSCDAGMKPGDGNHPHLARYLAESEDRPQRKLYLWFRPLARRDCRVYRQASSVKTASPLEKVFAFLCSTYPRQICQRRKNRLVREGQGFRFSFTL